MKLKPGVQNLIDSIKSSFRAPSVMIIELTDECNANCVMCPREHMNHQPVRMDWDLFRKAVSDAKELGIKVFQLSFFGESLLLDDFGERVSYIKEQIPGAVVVTRTNAALLTPEVSANLLQRGLDLLMISVDGNNGEEYDDIRKGIRFEDVERNIHSLKKLRDDGGYASQISIWCLSTKNYPIDEVAFHAKWDQWVDAISIRDEHDVRVTKREGILNKIVPCHYILTQILVKASGQVVQCQYDWLGKTNMGDMRKNSAASIWHSPKFRLYRLINILGLKKVFLMCRRCDVPFVKGSFCHIDSSSGRSPKSWLSIP